MRALLPEVPLIRLLTAFAATFPPRGEGFRGKRISPRLLQNCPGLGYSIEEQ